MSNVKSAGKINTSLKSYQNANVFIKCLEKFKYLTKILDEMKFKARYVDEDIEYIGVSINQRTINNITFPMICFCDIPINKLKEHVDWYGGYAICLTKSWGIEKVKLAPVHYLNQNSELTGNISEYINHILSKGREVDNVVLNIAMNQLFWTKPYSGKQYHSTKGEVIDKLFMDEQEWRHIYLPSESSNERNINDFYIDKNQDLKNEYNEIISYDEKNGLKFEIDDIRYIVVPDAKERDLLIDYIVSKMDIPKKESYKLISKILVLSEIEEDFN